MLLHGGPVPFTAINRLADLILEATAAGRCHALCCGRLHSSFALVPLLLVLVVAASFLGRDVEALDRTLESLEVLAPSAVADVIRDMILDVESELDGRQGLLIGLGVLLLL